MRSSRRRIGTAAAVFSCLCALLLCVAVLPADAAPFQRQITSDHFRITYMAGVGPDAVSAQYAKLVQESLETAYEILVQDYGFSIFPGRIDVHILAPESGEMGAEYLDVSTGTPRPVIEVATEGAFEEIWSSMFVDTPVDDLVRSTAAHELFHVIQDYASLHGEGDISEMLFVEAHATAIQEAVVPAANDYLEPALDFLLAPDSMAFLQRTYEAGLFWIFVIERLGTVQFYRDLMAASASYEGMYAIEHALVPYGLTFDDLWAEFAVTLATERLADREALHRLALSLEESIEWETGQTLRDGVSLPTPVHVAAWKGTGLAIDHVNSLGWGSWYGTFDEDPIDSPLRVAHAYGIDVIEIIPATDASMTIAFSGDHETRFLVFACAEKSGTWTIAPIAQDAPWTISSPDAFDRIRLAVTRTEPGTGAYSIHLSPATP